jgi:tetratricopeptide (TPR) repeat protein
MEQLNLGEEGLAALEAGDSTVRAMLLARYGSDVHWMLPGNYKRATTLLDEALAMARRLDDAATLAFVLASRVFTLQRPDDVELRIAEAEELVVVAEEAGDAFMHGAAYLVGTCLYWTVGDLDSGDRYVNALGVLKDETRLPIAPWWEALLQAARALMSGRFADADVLRERFHALLPDFDWEYVPHLVLLRREQGRLHDISADVLAHYRQQTIDDDLLRRHAGVHQLARTLMALIDLELGQAASSRAVFDELAENEFANLRNDYLDWPCTLALLSELCAAFSDRQRAERLYDLLVSYADRNTVGLYTIVFTGSAHHYLGLLAVLLERWSDAARHFENALSMNTRMEMWPYVAHTRYAYADMLVKRGESGDRERALELIGQALGLAEEIGMVRLEQQALALKVHLQGILNA